MIMYDYVTGEWGMKATQGLEIELEGDDETRETVKSLALKEEQEFLGVWDCLKVGSKKKLEKNQGNMKHGQCE